jgi:hypothetical protein
VKTILTNALFLFLFLFAGLVQAYKPYCQGDVAKDEVKSKLQAEGFTIVGEYTPESGGQVIVVTNDALKNTAKQSVRGGYGAIQRVAINGDVVSYTNPPYWANAYRMATDLNDVKAALEKALGNCRPFGSEDGMTNDELRKYRYMMGMPKFDKPVELYTHPTYDKCVEVVEAGLKSDQGDKDRTEFVYRVDIPEKDETVFGMGVLGDCAGSDKKAMEKLNKATGKPEHTAYMPYEILCQGTKAEILDGKFRIAIAFPDLTMWTFGKIRKAPGCIAESAEIAATP